MEELLERVRKRIEAGGLSKTAAARAIGVSSGSLERHLAGAYVRSDSLAKYRAWLDPRMSATPKQSPLVSKEPRQTSESSEQDRLAALCLASPASSNKRHLIVDLFSGCGGMSLGFDLFHDGGVFETVLAVDLEEAMVTTFNENKAAATGDVCRRLDLSDLKNEAEILAYYLDHLATQRHDETLADELDRLPVMPLHQLKASIAAVDNQFLERLKEIRASEDFMSGLKAVPRTVYRQTSVMGFHELLGLPLSTARALRLPPLLWSEPHASARESQSQELADLLASPNLKRLRDAAKRDLRRLWRSAEKGLEAKSTASGRGQLASSAGRIKQFLDFATQPVWQEIRKIWLEWRSARDALRTYVFLSDATHDALESAYTEDRRISVLLGGPPCQGFSRIGRGKIRSLREHGVHVQEDTGAGDARNRLLDAYVLCVAALKPRLFLFENVRHFQAEVKTPDGTFHASDALAQAISDISHETVSYEVSNRIIDCRLHLIPQTRERFFMAGVRKDLIPGLRLRENIADWCLSLTRREQVPLRTALEGLPQPHALSKMDPSGPGERALSKVVEASTNVPGPAPEADEFMRWVTQSKPGGLSSETEQKVDAHVIRPPRQDDRDLFALMGPGTRWMDYRCEGSETLASLSDLLEQVESLVKEVKSELGPRHLLQQAASAISEDKISALRRRVNGSLSIRLLLENMDAMPGELQHHLLTESYLGKREGQHGDWLARMNPDRPSKTIVAHMGKDTYAYVHPSEARTLSVREAARIQTFPDWFELGSSGFVDAFRIVGNAVPPLLGAQLAGRLAQVLWATSSD